MALVEQGFQTVDAFVATVDPEREQVGGVARPSGEDAAQGGLEGTAETGPTVLEGPVEEAATGEGVFVEHPGEEAVDRADRRAVEGREGVSEPLSSGVV